MQQDSAGTLGAVGRTRLLLLAALALCGPSRHGLAAGPVDYDIVYVRWPRAGDSTLIMLPQAEDPYRVIEGADLVLLHPDGTERVLIDCVKCCVQDPMVSLDGEWVYYTKVTDASDVKSPSFLYKMHIAGAGADYREVQLTFNDGFDTKYHAATDSAQDDLGAWFSLRDMGPAPLPGGRIAFTSNRSAVIAARQGSAFNVADAAPSCVMQVYVMDDHDGSLNTAALSNLHQIGFGNLRMALHPFVLMDGRILFSNWDDAGGKFIYAMTTLYAIHPDGTGLEAITEPHDHHKNVEHFATQLATGDVVTGQYYPSFDFGFGQLCRFPIDPPGPDFTRDPSKAKNTYNGWAISYRNFDRKSWESLTPHTAPDDCPAPNLSGKYSMPCAAPNGALLVAYSPGGVNHFSGCNQGNHAFLESGIYLIPSAETGVVTDPKNAAQLVKIVNSPDYNEIWPRAVVSYEEVYGIREPRTLAPVDSARPKDDRLEPAEPHALVGTSSLYNRESVPLGGDPFRPCCGSRELHPGGWTIQGTDTGVVKDSDIWGVRIIGVVPNPHRDPINKWGSTHVEHAAISYLLPDPRSDRFVEGFTAAHGERWKIIGEFPVRKRDESGNQLVDPKGDPDTSFVAKIPADTAFFYQGIDQNGMTLFSELTWRSTVSGEVRTDCGGCHGHSITPVDFDGTAAAHRFPIQAPGLAASDPMIANGLWDLTKKTPLVAADGSGSPIVKTADGGMVGVEYFRDVKPILDARCVSCHNTASNRTGTDLAFDGTGKEDDAYYRLVMDRVAKFGGTPAGGSNYSYPQLTKYVRAMQSRQSYIVWKLFGKRLDGRGNGDRNDDLDFTPHSAPHGATIEECRTIARWIDLGCPRDFQGPLHEGYRYTNDNGLPVINVGTPARGGNPGFDGILRVGCEDAESGIDWSTLEVSIDTDLSDGVQLRPVSLQGLQRPKDSTVAWVGLPAGLPADRSMLLVTSVRDAAGNKNVDSRRFWIGEGTDPGDIPARPNGGGVSDGGGNSGASPTGGGTSGHIGGGGGGGCIAARGDAPRHDILLVIGVLAATVVARRRVKGR